MDSHRIYYFYLSDTYALPTDGPFNSLQAGILWSVSHSLTGTNVRLSLAESIKPFSRALSPSGYLGAVPTVWRTDETGRDSGGEEVEDGWTEADLLVWPRAV